MLERTPSEFSILNMHKPIRPGLERAPTSINLAKPLPRLRLDGKVALIIGGGGKVGIETAGRLMVEGANVALVDIDQPALEGAIGVLKAAIPTGVPIESRLLTMVADATIEADIEACVKKTLQRFDRLDCALLSAGERDENKSIFETTEEEYEKTMSVNVKSAFFGVKHVAAAMRTLGNGGSIILRSSIAGLRGFPGLASYSASRFATRGLALSAAEELGQYGIRVNTIHTSIMATPGYKEGWSEENLAEVRGDTVLGRLGMPDDVAAVVSFLASEDSRFMTGGHLKIDGGCVST
jgi:NAD(P)-dependent dehydrogenase (short-subunit alcohol dehydrogenase family)